MDRLSLEGVRIVFPNFSGVKKQFNEEGNRNFSVLIEDLALAERLLAEGWALKPLRDRDTEEIDAYHLPVRLNYDGRFPPRVYKVSPSTKSTLMLTEETVGMLDFVPIDYIDIEINPYEWSVRGDKGVKAYCKSMWAVIEESELDLKWAEFFHEPEF